MEIDENDIRGVQQVQNQYQTELAADGEDENSEDQAMIQSQLQRENAIELRFIFALADFLKMQA